MITFCMTSCNRPELLKRTLRSFFKWNTAKIERYIIVDDSGKPGCIDEIKKLYPKIEIYYNPVQVGMMRNIDIVYSKVRTPYIFHCEDDWEFFRGGFIEKSYKLLLEFPQLLTVWLRTRDDTNGHPISEKIEYVEDAVFRRVQFGYMDTFHGYTTNPGLRRLADWPGFGNIIKDSPTGEHIVSQYYLEEGYFSVILMPGYVKHIGWGQTTIKV